MTKKINPNLTAEQKLILFEGTKKTWVYAFFDRDNKTFSSSFN